MAAVEVDQDPLAHGHVEHLAHHDGPLPHRQVCPALQVALRQQEPLDVPGPDDRALAPSEAPLRQRARALVPQPVQEVRDRLVAEVHLLRDLSDAVVHSGEVHEAAVPVDGDVLLVLDRQLVPDSMQLLHNFFYLNFN